MEPKRNFQCTEPSMQVIIILLGSEATFSSFNLFWILMYPCKTLPVFFSFWENWSAKKITQKKLPNKTCKISSNKLISYFATITSIMSPTSPLTTPFQIHSLFSTYFTIPYPHFFHLFLHSHLSVHHSLLLLLHLTFSYLYLISTSLIH